MAGSFDWDDAKAATNLRKHRVSFEEAQTVFGDERSLTIYDEAHSETEDRYIILGMSIRARLLVVVFTENAENIRIISARRATKKESNQYGDL